MSQSKACFNCQGTMYIGTFGWYCFDCDTYEPDDDTGKIVDTVFNLKQTIEKGACRSKQRWVEMETCGTVNQNTNSKRSFK
jgi:hypothetical protein